MIDARGRFPIIRSHFGLFYCTYVSLNECTIASVMVLDPELLFL